MATPAVLLVQWEPLAWDVRRNATVTITVPVRLPPEHVTVYRGGVVHVVVSGAREDFTELPASQGKMTMYRCRVGYL